MGRSEGSTRKRITDCELLGEVLMKFQNWTNSLRLVPPRFFANSDNGCLRGWWRGGSVPLLLTDFRKERKIMINQSTGSVNPAHLYRSAWSVLRPATQRMGLFMKGAMLMLVLALGTRHGNSQTLHSFTGGADGAFPFGGLAVGPNGVLYGVWQRFGTKWAVWSLAG